MKARCLLALIAIAVTMTCNSAVCVSAPRIDISKNPPQRQPTPYELEKSNESQEKIKKEMEELERKRNMEKDHDNQQEMKKGQKTA